MGGRREEISKDADADLLRVLESAAKLQRLVPGAVLVGGTAAIVHAGHRASVDHDHVLTDLADRFEMVLDAVEKDEGWATNHVVPGKVILGNLDGIEAGVRQMIRKRPLETMAIELPTGGEVVVPTIEEALRIKAFLVVRRNQTRDYLDVAALSDRMGHKTAAAVLSRMDDYYADQHGEGDGIATQVVRQLADPRPADSAVTHQLDTYKRLDRRWSDWEEVKATLKPVAAEMVVAG